MNVAEAIALLGFLRAVVWNNVSNFLRRAHLRREVLMAVVPDRSALDLESALLAADELALVDAIKPKRRALLVAFAMGCGVDEIAEDLRIPIPTVWSRLRVARLDLLAILRRRGVRER